MIVYHDLMQFVVILKHIHFFFKLCFLFSLTVVFSLLIIIKLTVFVFLERKHTLILTNIPFV